MTAINAVDTRYTSVNGLAAYLGVSRWTISRMLDDGEIPHVCPRGTPRIAWDDVHAWEAAQKEASLKRAEDQKIPGLKRRVGRPKKQGIGKAVSSAASAA